MKNIQTANSKIKLSSFENCIAYINDEDLVEVTPLSLRLHKRVAK